MLVHKIRQLKKVSNIDEIIVSSDSDIMLDMAKNEGVSTHKRDVAFCDEKTKTFNEVVEHIASSIKTDVIMWAPCVCPLTEVKSYESAINNFEELVISEKLYDSVVSAKLFKEYLFDEKGPLNWNPDRHVPSQQLPDWKTIVNGFYIAEREKMIEWKYLYGKNPYLYLLNKREAVDIDDAEDFEVAKALLGVGGKYENIN